MAKRKFDSVMPTAVTHSGRGERAFEGYYEGRDAARSLMNQDGGMIHNDPSKTANLPQEVIMKPYAKITGYSPSDSLDDTIRGIDDQINGDNRKKLANMKPQKY